MCQIVASQSGNWIKLSWKVLTCSGCWAASCQHDMLCSYNTDNVRAVSVEEVQVCLEERCSAKFFRGWRLMLGILEKSGEHKVLKGISFFLAAASEDKIGFSNDFPALPATLD